MVGVYSPTLSPWLAWTSYGLAIPLMETTTDQHYAVRVVGVFVETQPLTKYCSLRDAHFLGSAPRLTPSTPTRVKFV